MFYYTDNLEELEYIYNQIGLNEKAKVSKSALIKINLARIPVMEHPRTSKDLLRSVIDFLSKYNIECTIAETADGYLSENLSAIGMEEYISSKNVKILDLDLEETDEVFIGDEKHYYPKCLKEYDIRIAIPATSKRPNSIYSNNVKLFVGIVPRRYYQMGEPVRHRVKIHVDLHKSVVNIYKGIMGYAPFDYYINGDLAMKEGFGEFNLPNVYIGNDALELDMHILNEHFDITTPEYLLKLHK